MFILGISEWREYSLLLSFFFCLCLEIRFFDVSFIDFIWCFFCFCVVLGFIKFLLDRDFVYLSSFILEFVVVFIFECDVEVLEGLFEFGGSCCLMLEL